MNPNEPVNVGQMLQFSQSVNGALAGIYARFVQIKRSLYALEAERRLELAGRTARLEMRFRSQYGEDCIIWELLGGQLDGFYIEVGAFNGRDYAVTWALDALGWNGLLIEAIPEQFEACRRNRPHARVVHAALGARGSSGHTTFTVTDDEYGGMLSFQDPTSDHARVLARERKIASRTVTVPFTDMDTLLQGHTGPIDVASIDVEGAEVQVLQGFDLVKFRPRILLLEDNDLAAETRVTRAMDPMPYQQVTRLDASRVYVHKDESAIFRRAKGLPVD